MKRLFLLYSAAAIAFGSFPTPPIPPHDPIAAADGLIGRLLGPTYVGVFQLSAIPPDPATGRDVFEIDESSEAPFVVALRGNTGVSLASALSWYLRYYVNASVSWGRNGSGKQLTTLPQDPQHLPRPTTKYRQVTPNAWRYYQNVCTFGYSTVWWTFERWQAEVDLMALNGINAPLAFVGTESVLLKFFASLGIQQDALLQDWFSGPAFLPWNRMNNMRVWGSPLSLDWIAAQNTLQKQILAAMRGYGMAPILSGWSGRVPSAFTSAMPGVKVFALPSWAGFNATYSSSLNIDPLDPAFVPLGINYTRMLADEYGLAGTANVYQSDLFNEQDPSTDDPSYLQGANAAMVASVTGADRGGIYMMQGWLFRFSSFWQGSQGQKNAQAFISGLPVNNSIILDLNTDQAPVWQNYESFYGRAWVWNTLAVFGGRRGLYGSLDRISAGPTADRASSPSMVGFGSTPEAIEEIPLFFDLVWEMNWRDQAPADLDEWVVGYAQRRYALPAASAADPKALLPQAMTLLRQAVYSSSNMDETPLENSPSFTDFSSRNTNATALLGALRLFLHSAVNKEVDPSLPTWQYDCVDLTRQVMVNAWDDIHHYQALAYQPFIAFGANTSADVSPLTSLMLGVTSDLDRLLATNENFLLGNWIADARAWAVSGDSEEADLLELNARNQLTLWGPGSPLGSSFDNSIDDYAAKHWQGLVGDYYASRWALQARYVAQSLQSGVQPDWEAYAEDHLALEQAFTSTTVASKSYPTAPSGESCLDLALAALDKYAPDNGGSFADDYVALANTDAAGPYNVFQAWNSDPSFLMQICSLAPSCAGFNSGGWIKPNGTLNWLKLSNGTTLWVKKSQLKTDAHGLRAIPASKPSGKAIPGLLREHCGSDDYDVCLAKANAHAQLSSQWKQQASGHDRATAFSSFELQDTMPRLHAVRKLYD